MSPPQRDFRSLITFVLLCYLGWMFFRRISKTQLGPPSPDPWDDRVAADLNRDDSIPLCHHCLTPHDKESDFCANCGAAVGLCTNLLPYPYIFSLGHTLRIGTGEYFKRSPVTVLGYVVLSTLKYGLFAPVYWFLLAKNVARISRAGRINQRPSGLGSGPAAAAP